MFNPFRKQTKPPAAIMERLGQCLADQTPEDFSSLWGRCVFVDGTAEVALFYQPARMPGRVDRLALGSSEKAELVRTFQALRESLRAQHPDSWITATLILDGEGGFDSDFTYDALSAQDLAAFERQWEGRHLAGLTFKDQPLLRVDFNSLPDAFKAALEDASEKMRHKIEAHQALWGLGQTNNWSVDLDEGVIRFQRPDGVVATCPVQVVASWVDKDEDWLWGWVNPSFPEPSKAHAEALRRYGSTHALPALTTARLVCDEAMAWRLTALAVQLSDAQSAYCGVTRNGKVFMTLGKVKLSKG